MASNNPPRRALDGGIGSLGREELITLARAVCGQAAAFAGGHGNIHPENIFVSADGSPWLGERAKHAPGEWTTDELEYMAPELFWYGEGDEKIWVDDDDFPSHFGTGTEDYYNCSWAPVVVFHTPFGGAPRADEKSSHGYNAFMRTRNLDAIPFKSKFRFDIEVYVPNPDDVVIAPERVWRDDIFTYIDLGEKALNMTQRPIVTLIVERVEVPVGFRTKGPNNRLIIVEAIGDMVLRNGKRIICLKLRRSDEVGLDNISYADDITDKEWDVPAPLPEGKQGKAGSAKYPEGFDGGYPTGQFDIGVGSAEMIVPEYANGGAGGNGSGDGVTIRYRADGSLGGGLGGAGAGAGGMGGNGDFDYSKMHRISNTQEFNAAASSLASRYRYGSGFADGSSNISIELGTDADVENLENLWDNLSSKYSKILKNYDPFFSVDTPADGQGKELFHLRIGPVETLDEGDGVCSKLGRNGVFCSVVRTQ